MFFWIVIDSECKWVCRCFFFQAEDGIRDLVRSRGLGDVYKRQTKYFIVSSEAGTLDSVVPPRVTIGEVVRYRVALRLSLIHI